MHQECCFFGRELEVLFSFCTVCIPKSVYDMKTWLLGINVGEYIG